MPSSRFQRAHGQDMTGQSVGEYSSKLGRAAFRGQSMELANKDDAKAAGFKVYKETTDSRRYGEGKRRIR